MVEPELMLDNNVLRSLANNRWQGPFDWVARLYSSPRVATVQTSHPFLILEAIGFKPARLGTVPFTYAGRGNLGDLKIAVGLIAEHLELARNAYSERVDLHCQEMRDRATEQNRRVKRDDRYFEAYFSKLIDWVCEDTFPGKLVWQLAWDAVLRVPVKQLPAEHEDRLVKALTILSDQLVEHEVPLARLCDRIRRANFPASAPLFDPREDHGDIITCHAAVFGQWTSEQDATPRPIYVVTADAVEDTRSRLGSMVALAKLIRENDFGSLSAYVGHFVSTPSLCGKVACLDKTTGQVAEIFDVADLIGEANKA